MMKLGLLWFDDDAKRKVVEKLDEAAERYEERFGVRPTLVHLNPAQAEGLAHRRLRVCGDASLRRNYFLVGVDDADAAAQQPQAVSAVAVAEPEEEARPARRRSARARAVPSLAEVSSRHPRARRRVS
ncbi:MAG TPA: hypothetical protein VKT82_29435 [Ktedonobacterales bacterium]|nr:hypothetical protein [Ktedonobacterales bacterium]